MYKVEDPSVDNPDPGQKNIGFGFEARKRTTIRNRPEKNECLDFDQNCYYYYFLINMVNNYRKKRLLLESFWIWVFKLNPDPTFLDSESETGSDWIRICSVCKIQPSVAYPDLF